MAEAISAVRARFEGRRVRYMDGSIHREGWITRVRRQYLPRDVDPPPLLPFIDYATIATDDGFLRPGVPVNAIQIQD